MFRINKNPLLQRIIDKHSEELVNKYPLENRLNVASNVHGTFFHFGTYNDCKTNIHLYKSIIDKGLFTIKCISKGIFENF